MVNEAITPGADAAPNDKTYFESLPAELERLSGGHCLSDGERLLKDRDMLEPTTSLIPIASIESRPVSPIVELVPDTPPSLDDLLPDPILDPTALRGPIWNVDYQVLMTTPEPPEMLRWNSLFIVPTESTLTNHCLPVVEANVTGTYLFSHTWIYLEIPQPSPLFSPTIHTYIGGSVSTYSAFQSSSMHNSAIHNTKPFFIFIFHTLLETDTH